MEIPRARTRTTATVAAGALITLAAGARSRCSRASPAPRAQVEAERVLRGALARAGFAPRGAREQASRRARRLLCDAGMRTPTALSLALLGALAACGVRDASIPVGTLRAPSAPGAAAFVTHSVALASLDATQQLRVRSAPGGYAVIARARDGGTTVLSLASGAAGPGAALRVSSGDGRVSDAIPTADGWFAALEYAAGGAALVRFDRNGARVGDTGVLAADDDARARVELTSDGSALMAWRNPSAQLRIVDFADPSAVRSHRGSVVNDGEWSGGSYYALMAGGDLFCTFSRIASNTSDTATGGVGARAAIVPGAARNASTIVHVAGGTPLVTFVASGDSVTYALDEPALPSPPPAGAPAAEGGAVLAWLVAQSDGSYEVHAAVVHPAGDRSATAVVDRVRTLPTQLAIARAGDAAGRYLVVTAASGESRAVELARAGD